MEQGLITNESFLKDKDGISYKHPERSCKECLKYPCFKGQDISTSCNYARYGCIKYIDEDMKLRGEKCEKEKLKDAQNEGV